MKKALIFVENEYEDLEFWYPYLRLKEEEFEIDIVGTGTSKIYKGKHGLEVTPDYDSKEVLNNEYDLIFIPGGYAPDKLRRHQDVLNIIISHFNKGKIIGTICHGPQVLISCRILKGIKLTAVFSIKDDIENAQAEFVNEPVVVFQNIVSARVPKDLPLLMPALIKRVKENL